MRQILVLHRQIGCAVYPGKASGVASHSAGPMGRRSMVYGYNRRWVCERRRWLQGPRGFPPPDLASLPPICRAYLFLPPEEVCAKQYCVDEVIRRESSSLSTCDHCIYASQIPDALSENAVRRAAREWLCVPQQLESIPIGASDTCGACSEAFEKRIA